MLCLRRLGMALVTGVLLTSCTALTACTDPPQPCSTAAKAGLAIAVGSFPFMANGRARCLGETDGGVKLLADAKTDRIVGLHVLGPRASDLIAEAALAVEFGASAEDVARAVHAHPTLPEAVKEAALAAGKRAIHI